MTTSDNIFWWFMVAILVAMGLGIVGLILMGFGAYGWNLWSKSRAEK